MTLGAGGRKEGRWSRDHWWGYAWIQSPSSIPLMVNLVEKLVTTMTVSFINVNTMVLEVQSPFCYNILIGHINKKLYVVRHQYNIVLRKHFKLEIDSAYLHMQLCMLMKLSVISKFAKLSKLYDAIACILECQKDNIGVNRCSGMSCCVSGSWL